MEAKICFLIALICSAQAKPFGSICETQSLLPSVLPGTSTVCETTPNYPGLGRPFGLSVPYGLGGLGQTTVCESTPNLGLPFGYQYPYLPSTTMCETVSNPVPYSPFYGFPGPTTVCETVPNLSPFGGLGSLGNMGLPYWPMNNLGSTTVCESSPALPYGYGGPGYGGPGYGGYLGLGAIDPIGLGSTTVCETTPNMLPLGHIGYPYSRGYPYPYSLGMPFL